MPKYKYVLLDLDNTLLDFKAAEEYSFYYTGREFGLELTAENLTAYRKINDALWAKLEEGELTKAQVISTRFAGFFEIIGASADPILFNSHYLDNLSLHTVPIVGALDICKKLHDSCTVIVATNGVSSTQHRRIAASGLETFFHHVLVSDDAGAEKPSPIYFNHLFADFGIQDKSTCIMVGDSLAADIKGGLLVGIDTCYFNPNGKVNSSDIKPSYEISALCELENIIL